MGAKLKLRTLLGEDVAGEVGARVAARRPSSDHETKRTVYRPCAPQPPRLPVAAAPSSSGLMLKLSGARRRRTAVCVRQGDWDAGDPGERGEQGQHAASQGELHQGVRPPGMARLSEGHHPSSSNRRFCCECFAAPPFGMLQASPAPRLLRPSPAEARQRSAPLHRVDRAHANPTPAASAQEVEILEKLAEPAELKLPAVDLRRLQAREAAALKCASRLPSLLPYTLAAASASEASKSLSRAATLDGVARSRRRPCLAPRCSGCGCTGSYFPPRSQSPSRTMSLIAVAVAEQQIQRAGQRRTRPRGSAWGSPS